jgi:hypothetical protein
VATLPAKRCITTEIGLFDLIFQWISRAPVVPVTPYKSSLQTVLIK